MTPRAPMTLVVLAAATCAVGVIGIGSGCGGSSSPSTTAGSTSPATTTTSSGAGARTFRDPFGDVTPGQPDLTALRISNDARTVRMEFRFAGAPPLAANLSAGWTDMLLMGIDIPPIGGKPTPNGWLGLDYALGMHGVDDRAVFRDMHQTKRQITTLRSRVAGSTISIDVPRALIGDPPYFDFNVAVAREGAPESATGDSIPASGTLRYAMAPGA